MTPVMTNAGSARLLGWFQDYADGFRSEDGVLAPALELKRLHSLRVAANAQQIGQALGFADAEVELAMVAGLLHDVGRFTQFLRYRSFCDADTMDHGEEGYRLLSRDCYGLFETEVNRERVLCAVRYHNRRAEDIPSDLAPECDALLRLVRDADKIDIVELVLQSVAASGFQELPSMLRNVRLTRDVTPAILAKAMARQSFSSATVATLGDFLLLLSTWFPELNYAPSRALACQKGQLERLRRELPDTRELNRYFESNLGMTQCRLDSHRLGCFG